MTVTMFPFFLQYLASVSVIVHLPMHPFSWNANGRTRIFTVIFAFDFAVALAIFGTKCTRRFLHREPYTPRLSSFRRNFWTTQLSHAIKSPANMNTTGNDVSRKSRWNCSDSVNAGSDIIDEFATSCLVDGADEIVFQFVRLDEEPDSDFLKEISTKDDVGRKIKEVREKQSLSGRADLYPRDWESRPENELLSIDSIEADPQIASFTVMQFNALAEGLSSCCSKRPFKFDKNNTLYQRDPKEFGGFTSIPHPSITLDFSLRKWRLLEVILGDNLDAPYDIIALEEIDRYYGFFCPILKMYGYDGIFVPKKNSPGVRNGWYSDGCVLVWKRSVFDLLYTRTGDYTVGNQVYIVATLRHTDSNQMMIVGATHLKAQQSEANELTRCRQVEELLKVIDDEYSRLITADSLAGGNVSIIVLGDFNADPSFRVEFSASAIEKILTHRVLSVNSSSALNYYSAYCIDNPSDIFFTSWKIRGSKESKRIIDYIFYTGSSIRCTAILKDLALEEIEPTKLPGLRYPSDHLHICAKFKIEKSSR
jgi:mRNA deadenylase 3'-5' endonuclease subunit Ccr4